MENAVPTPIVVAGRNCWRIERARRAAVIVDAADYYRLIKGVMERARRRILIIGWDFDTRIALEPDENGKGETLGRFFLRLAREQPARTIDVLKWNFGALKQLAHPAAVVMLWRWYRTRAIDFRLDSAHPPGCSHHQKIVVVDDHLAVCGGIDISNARWDTSRHQDDDPRRTLPTGKPYRPWHDATMIVEGSTASALAELGRDRWRLATGVDPGAADSRASLWPAALESMFDDVDIAIARTRAAYQEVEQVGEIEALWLDMIAATRRFAYIENQYLTSGKIAAAIAARMEEEDPPEFVLVMPRVADGWLEQKAMDAARIRLARAIGKVDRRNRFRIYVPVTPGGTDIYVHAKVAIVDDRLLRVGSSNLNNRSQGLDSECDLIIDAALPHNHDVEPQIVALRNRLMAEHLDSDPTSVAAEFARTGSLVAVIDALNGRGRHLELLDMEKPGPLEEFIADNELLDPETADGFFEPLATRGIWKGWQKGLGWRRRRAAARAPTANGEG
ncbi:phospholipase D-like domain-containing protein [Sphingomonas cavernae]|uniref:Phospholipase D n=1 Tax=Sphingomonas cavernae TaxID=2320861 RepID=A0A418WRS7_9SPHN|nr:phospholipase D-like domain-containing protein [Sphingomonas cavernae]RJF93935.1 phospholipase [Sphingomonas cavernae]